MIITHLALIRGFQRVGSILQLISAYFSGIIECSVAQCGWGAPDTDMQTYY